MIAAVTSGIYLGWHAPELMRPETRLQSLAVWEILVFLMNAFLFALVGLQLPVCWTACRASRRRSSSATPRRSARR